MNYAHASQIAMHIQNQLDPYCERIEVAGSIRRCKPEVKDIELVVIPKTVSIKDVFGKHLSYQPIPEYVQQVQQWKRIKGDAMGKMTQRQLPQGIMLDLFTATHENFGWMLALRTGPAEYGRDFLLKALKRFGYKADKGLIWRFEKLVPVPTEEAFFNLLNMPVPKPEKRGV